MTISKFILSALITAIIFPSIILLAAGNIFWLEGRSFAIWFDVMVLFNMIYL